MVKDLLAMNSSHRGSTPSSPTPMDEEIDPVEQIRSSKRLKSSEPIEPMNPDHQRSATSPSTMKPSQPSSVDSVHHSPPMDTVESGREMCEKIDVVEELKPLDKMMIKPIKILESSGYPIYNVELIREKTIIVEEIKPSQISKTSRWMKPYQFIKEPSQHSPVDSGPPSPSTDAIESIRRMYEKIDPVELIDPLVRFIEKQLNKTPSEMGSSSSEGSLFTVWQDIQYAAAIIDIISKEAKKDAVNTVASATLKVIQGLGELHVVWTGISAAAYAVDMYESVGSTDKEWRELLLKILELSIHVKQYSEQMPMPEREKLCNAVSTIVECAVMCCDYLQMGLLSRFWSPTTAAAQLAKINQQLGKDYGEGKDVFLSHSGQQKNFVRQLREDLKREDVSSFFDEDDNSFPLGDKFPPLIFKAAETCKTAVVVLSKEFIKSKWSMLELSAFISAIETGKNAKLALIPIFFKILPSELSSFSEDCQEWQKLKVSNDTRRKWQHALHEVRAINGVLFAEGGNEVECRKKVVEKICCFVRGINPPKLLDFEPVGIEEQVRQVKKLLDMEGREPSLAVIVYGLGGVGKSTIAASAVQSLNWSSMNFKFCSVAINRKTQDKTSHIMKLQKDIINNLEGIKPDLRDSREGRYLIKEALENKSCLLFIDNVVDNCYIRDLLPTDLQPGHQQTKLRIIITSLEKSINAEFNIICKEYEVKGLSDADSKRLLVDTIVQGQLIEQNEKRMINEVAVACKGIPLLLSVFGKHIRMERNENSFQEALDVLRDGNLDSFRNEGLGTKLMFAYHKIKDVEVKEAFLDICAYFHGWEWGLVADIVDFFKLEDLRRRTLVSKSSSGEVIVHDILLLMGLKEARLTRFSNYKELSHALDGNLDGFDMRYVKGISLVNDRHLITIQSRQLEAMHHSLRVLMLGDWVTLDGPRCNRAFRNLRYLRVGDIAAFPFKYPFKLERLRVFLNKSKPGMNLPDLPSSLKRISHEVPHVECNQFVKLPFANLRCLKSFILKTHKSVELPEELQLPSSLKDLNLIRCKNLPKDIGHLTALEVLILDRSEFKCLPQGFGQLKKLRHLNMDYCSKLTFLPEELGMLSSLEVLSIKGCGSLRALPERLGELLSLQTLKFSECINLPELPESIGQLRIQSLNLHSLVSLKEFPKSTGHMPLLKNLSLKSYHSLTSLPKSFVQLKMLETLKIIDCTKLRVLPEDFGHLRYLNHMTVETCHLLKELPHGFGALPALKTFTLRSCYSFVNLPRDFRELTSLQELRLVSLPLKRIPDGFIKLKRLRILYLVDCFQLKTLSDDFENMASVEQLVIQNCPELDGTMMEKILKLQHCYIADIDGSRKLLEKWRQMQSAIEQPIAVLGGAHLESQENRWRAIRVALLNGKCVEANYSSGQLMERSSLLVGLEEGTTATVALIMLPVHMQSHEHQTLQRFVEMARERVETNGTGKLQIVCARKVDLDAERPTVTEEEERAEEEAIREILLSLPLGSCAIPSSESKRVKILTKCFSQYRCVDKPSFFMGNVGFDIEGRQYFKNEVEISGNVTTPPPSEIRKAENKHYNSIQNFIKSICPEDKDWRSQFEYDAGKSKTRDFMEALKDNRIHYLLNNNTKSQVMVDDLHGKTIGFIVCDCYFLECMKLQQIYKDLQQKDSNFIWIWVPTVLSEDCGHGCYTSLIQRLPWATFPHPQLVNFESREPCFALLDKHGQIANYDALPLLLGWGVKSYPFTQHTIPETFSSMDSESCLEFLLHGMNIVGRKAMKSEMTFLYAEYPSKWFKMKCKLEELTQMHGIFEVLYVGPISYISHMFGIENLKQDYEDATQNMCWPSLSFSDMIMFGYRCKYLAKLNKESNIMMEILHGLAKQLCHYETSLVLVDNDGVVTFHGEDVVEMICGPSDDISNVEGMEELIASLSRGGSSVLQFVKTCFRDRIDNHTQHPQHRLHRLKYELEGHDYVCGVCSCQKLVDYEKWSYSCEECEWFMCGSCWMAYAKHQAEQLLAKQQIEVEQLPDELTVYKIPT